MRWQLESKQQFLRSFPGYTMSDGGEAVILERSHGEAGILGSTFIAVSSHWQIGTLGDRKSVV